MKKTAYVIVMITCSSGREALKIKTALLEGEKAACVNIIPKVDSFFWWKAKIDSAHEVMLLAKTKSDRLKGIVTLVKKIHKYEVPEIIALPITGGNNDYLKWISDSLSCKDK